MLNRLSVWSQNHFGVVGVGAEDRTEDAVANGNGKNDPRFHLEKWLIVVDSPSQDLLLRNRVASNDFPDGSLIVIDGKYVATTSKVAASDMREEELALNGLQKTWMKLLAGQCVKTQSYSLNLKQKISLLIISLRFRNRDYYECISNPFNVVKLAKSFINQFHGQVLQPTQLLLFDFNSIIFECHVDTISIETTGIPSQGNNETYIESAELATKGFLTKSTHVNFFSAIDSSNGRRVPLLDRVAENHYRKPQIRIRSRFKFDTDFGIGGLNDEFSKIFRRAFMSRLIPIDMVEKLGIQHTKGILLYGPPGTGKTMLARSIAQLIVNGDDKLQPLSGNNKYITVVNGPELLSKYVGDSEKNLRDLFLNAEKENKVKGRSSRLYVIIFDELDSLFKKRGGCSSSSSGGNLALDNMVNQLLSKMDGVDQLNNLLIIGITNRVDLLDPALLRPGRFEIQIFIGLPDKDSRHEILKLKTQTLKKNKMLDQSVDLMQLAILTSNFSGAEIEGVVKSACSFSLQRIIDKEVFMNENDIFNGKKKISDDIFNISEKLLMKKLKITQNDFIAGINELTSSFQKMKPGEKSYNEILELTNDLSNFVIVNETTFRKNVKLVEAIISRFLYSTNIHNTKHIPNNLYNILIYGNAGSGKTLFSIYCCHELLKSKSSRNKDREVCVKMISTSELILERQKTLLNEQNKIEYILGIFRECYQHKYSIVIVDQLEDLIEYAAISDGIYFSNSILQVLKTCMKISPSRSFQNKILIFVTTRDKGLLSRLGISEASFFSNSIHIDMIQDIPSLLNVLKNNYSDDILIQKIINLLIEKLGTKSLNLSIKQVLNCISMLKYSEDLDRTISQEQDEKHTIATNLVALLLEDNYRNLNY